MVALSFSPNQHDVTIDESNKPLPITPSKTPSSVLGIMNRLREERGLPKAKRSRKSKKPRITREVIREIGVQVWKDQYPRAVTDLN